MRAEVKMANARFIGGRNWSPAQIAAGAICGLFYLLFLYTVMVNSQSVDFRGMLIAMLGISLLILPIVMHGVIAGEKEKRSLEMLLAAPVTSSQIAFAKLMRGSIFYLVVMSAFLVPMLIVLLVQFVKGEIQGADNFGQAMALMGISLLLIGVASLTNGCITLAVSAMCRSTSAAMLSCVGVHFFLLVFPWVLLGPLMAVSSGDASSFVSAILGVHPVGGLLQLLNMWDTNRVTHPAIIIISSLVVWLIICAACFSFVVSNLDGERRQGGRPPKGASTS